MSRTEPIWYSDIERYFTDINNYIHFIPDSKTSLEAQLNDAFRFSIYFGILVSILRNDMRALFFPLFVGILTYVIYRHEVERVKSRKKVLEKLNLSNNLRNKTVCMKPTENNPYMNVLISDYESFPNRPKACNPSMKTVKKTIQAFASDGVPLDTDNVYGKRLTDLRFNTMPSTTIPNEQTTFANWLYNKGNNSKESGVLNVNWR